jgi:hypothetical protein
MTDGERLADLKARRGVDNLGDQLRNERRISELLERMLVAAVARTCACGAEVWPGSDMCVACMDAQEAAMTRRGLDALKARVAAAQTCGTCRHWTRDVSDADYGRCWLIKSLATVEHVNHSCPKWAAKDSAKRG